MINIMQFGRVWLLLISLSVLYAVPITESVAEKNALEWMKSRNHQNYTIKKELFVNNPSKSTTNKNPRKYKILELEPNGWAIVSLDNAIDPIVGYGDSKINSKLPPAMIEYLDNIEKTIDYRNLHPKVLQKNGDKKMLYGANDYGYIVRPLLWMGSSSNTEAQGIRWDQGTYYNAYTPVDANGDHTWTGCVATAMGQLMRYWEYPSVGLSQHTYTPYSHPEYGEQYADFSATTYNWANMPLTLTSSNDAVAQALYQAGVAVEMDYTSEGSGAWMGDSLKKYFNYKLSVGISSDSIGENEWNSILKKELDEGRPIMYSGSIPSGAGHQFIIDGYDTDGYYHFNWGWGGYSNGKFTLDNMTFTSDQYAYIIAPVDPSSQITIEDSNFASCIVEQLSLKDSSEIKELILKYSNYLNCEDKDIDLANGLSYFKYIRFLYLDNNNLQGTLDLSDKTVLMSVDVSANNLTSINLNNSNVIEYFYASNNNLQGTLDLSEKMALKSFSIYSNNISNLLLPEKNSGSYDFADLMYNAQLNILKIQNLKNIKTLYAYGTQGISCWQKNALAAENNITNLYMDCDSNPSDSLDTDGDGIKNVDDPDDDNDGINDLNDNDIDGDEISNADETKWGLDPLNARDGHDVDTDGDGVSNKDEIEAGSDPLDSNDTKRPKKFVPVIMNDLIIMIPLPNK